MWKNITDIVVQPFRQHRRNLPDATRGSSGTEWRLDVDNVIA